jgi:hypothetical protein
MDCPLRITRENTLPSDMSVDVGVFFSHTRGDNKVDLLSIGQQDM